MMRINIPKFQHPLIMKTTTEGMMNHPMMNRSMIKTTIFPHFILSIRITTSLLRLLIKITINTWNFLQKKYREGTKTVTSRDPIKSFILPWFLWTIQLVRMKLRRTKRLQRISQHSKNMKIRMQYLKLVLYKFKDN